jgi:ABC-type branched-subunit amino acid transport system substrate-binding protein
VSGPIKIGFLNTKTGNAAAFGLNVGQTFEPRQGFEAVVAALNKSGGISGRQIVPVVADTDTASASWETDYQAACETLTRDNKVAVVVGYSFGLFDALESCLSKAGIPHLNGGYAVGDTETFAQLPYFVATTNATANRRFVLQLAGPLADGLLTPKKRVGILLDDCPEHARAIARAMEPYIRAHNINVVARATMSCPHGAADVGGVAAQIQNAVLQFRSRQVDTVVTEGIPVVVFAQQAQSQGWHPDYLLTTTSGGAALSTNVPAEQAEHMHGYGWFPAIDVTTGHGPAPTVAQQRCLDMLRSGGLEPAQYNDFVSSYTTCDGLFLYERALSATHASTDPRAVVAAIAGLGGGYASASTLDGRTSFTAGRRDAPAAYRPFGWDAGCTCFVYKGPAVAWS